MKNKYFLKTQKEQLQFQIRVGLIAITINLITGGILWYISPNIFPLSFLFISITVTVIAPFYDVPAMVKNGKLKYQSLFLLSESKKDSVMVIHGGTLFDYHFSLDEEMSGSQRTSLVLCEYLQGLLSLISTEDEDVILKGTSYIVSERTANKVGLRVVKTDVVQMLILAINYFNLVASLSKIKKKIEFPKLNRVLTYEGKVSEVKKREKYIREMIQKIDQSYLK